MTSAKFWDFLTPSPLVHIWDWSTVLNSRNLPYYIFFWANPLPPQCGRHIWMPPTTIWSRQLCSKRPAKLQPHEKVFPFSAFLTLALSCTTLSNQSLRLCPANGYCQGKGRTVGRPCEGSQVQFWHNFPKYFRRYRQKTKWRRMTRTGTWWGAPSPSSATTTQCSSIKSRDGINDSPIMFLCNRASPKGLSWVARTEPETSVSGRLAVFWQATLLATLCRTCLLVQPCTLHTVHCPA